MKLVLLSLQYMAYRNEWKAYQCPAVPKTTDDIRGYFPAPCRITQAAADQFSGPGLYEADVEADTESGYGRENRTGLLIVGLRLIGHIDFKAPSQQQQPKEAVKG